MPNEILFNEDLKDKEKLLYCFVSSLCAAEWYCWATNQYLADQLNVKTPKTKLTRQTISTYLNSLSRFWYLDIEMEYQWKQIVNRKITLWIWRIGIKEKLNTPIKEKTNTLLRKSLQNNNTSINNTNININTISKDIGENPPEVGVQEISLDDINTESEDSKRGEIQKTTELAETGIHPTPPTPSPRAKWPNPNVEAILSAIKQYHGWVDWSPAEERKYAHNLAKKIIAHPTFSEFLFRSENESEAIRLFVLAVCQRAKNYQTWWTTSPKSLYYNMLKIIANKPKNNTCII